MSRHIVPLQTQSRQSNRATVWRTGREPNGATVIEATELACYLVHGLVVLVLTDLLTDGYRAYMKRANVIGAVVGTCKKVVVA